MTLPGRYGCEFDFLQYRPKAFKKALLIGLREALQLGRGGPRSIVDEVVKQGLPDALEERSLHGRIEPRHERLHVTLRRLSEGSSSDQYKPSRCPRGLQ